MPRITDEVLLTNVNLTPAGADAILTSLGSNRSRCITGMRQGCTPFGVISIDTAPSNETGPPVRTKDFVSFIIFFTHHPYRSPGKPRYKPPIYGQYHAATLDQQHYAMLIAR